MSHIDFTSTAVFWNTLWLLLMLLMPCYKDSKCDLFVQRRFKSNIAFFKKMHHKFFILRTISLLTQILVEDKSFSVTQHEMGKLMEKWNVEWFLWKKLFPLFKIIRVEGRNYVRNFVRFQLSTLLRLCSQLLLWLSTVNFASKCEDDGNGKQLGKR
jgi:hypothetical protein